MGIIGVKDVKISFYFLIGSFGLSVSLRMIGSGKTNIVFEESDELSSKGRSELRTLVRDNEVVETIV